MEKRILDLQEQLDRGEIKGRNRDLEPYFLLSRKFSFLYPCSHESLMFQKLYKLVKFKKYVCDII